MNFHIYGQLGHKNSLIRHKYLEIYGHNLLETSALLDLLPIAAQAQAINFIEHK